MAPTLTIPAPSACAWLTDDTPALHRAICLRAHADIGICEMPLGSNRSGRIDEYNRAAGAEVGSYWCASALAAWWRSAGAEIPKMPSSCDEWMRWAMTSRRWVKRPVAGAAVLYGIPGDAQHCGLVIRVSPLVLSVEGNTSLDGFSRNGVAVDMKEVNLKRLLGYVLPIPVPSGIE